MKLTWKREKKQTGLRSIGAPPPGSKLHDGEKTYATTATIGGGMQGMVRGWYWVAGWDSDVPHMNTCSDPCETEDGAKKAAREYVMKHLPSNAKVRGPEAALSPEAPSRLTGYALEDK